MISFINNKYFRVTYLLISFISATLLAQGPELDNVHFEPDTGKIFISFDLYGDADDEYDITVLLQKKSDNEFSFNPVTITGDLSNIKTGKDKLIIWEIDKDIQYRLEGDDYYFLIKAEESSGGISWLLYTGASVVGGVLAYILLIDDDGNGEENIPSPPSRP